MLVCLALAGLQVGTRTASSQQRDLAVPLRTLYPNDVVKREAFITRPFVYNPDGPSRFVESIDEYVGLAAKSTLPAMQPVPISALERRREVNVGARLRLVFEEDGIVITAPGLALQKAAVGQTVQVRNIDTGAVLTGRLDKDDFVRMHPQ